ncbi:WD40/YVTN repeat-like containing protein [Gracilaria domingensis]|nr:WD40/YVTN repeat-like containing protein [Gracilaria domingensis]
MDGLRRTIPRSARRAPMKVEPKQSPSSLASPGSRYVPDFNPEAREPSLTLPLLTKHTVQALSTRPPAVSFTAATQTCVRWLPNEAEHAIALAGSGDGEQDTLTFYGVTARQEVAYEKVQELPHKGKVNKICVTDEGQIFTASSAGSIYTLSGADPSKAVTRKVYDMEKLGKMESIASVAYSSVGLIAAGVQGSLMIVDISTGKASGLQFDEVGFRDLISVDERGTEIITAGCDVAVWDVRSGDRTDLTHPGKSIATCVCTDPGQPQFVMGGMRNGELVIWDRRSDSIPLNRIGLHSGPIWDLGVVSSSRAGLLLACGEDGHVRMVDFACAGDRGGFGSMERTYCDQGEFWRARVSPQDISNLARETMAVNSVDAHRSAALFAYATDAGVVGFGSLS